MSRDWTLLLDDILEACSRIARYTSELTFAQFEADDKTRDAVIRNLEILGEAAKKLPDEVCTSIP